MGLFLASKLTRLALGAAQTALAAGEAYRTGKKKKNGCGSPAPPKGGRYHHEKIDFLQPFWCSSPPLPAR